jgi:hypothetical protein
VICLILRYIHYFIKESKELKKLKVGMPLLILWSCIGSKTCGVLLEHQNFPDANAWDGLNFSLDT